MAKAPGSKLTFGEADQVARDWWGRPIPRTLFSEAAAAETAAAALVAESPTPEAV